MGKKTLNKLVGEFIDAVVRDPPRAQVMLEARPDLLDSRWIHGETVLHFLAVENYVAGVRFLAERGAEVDATNDFGDTALIDVASLGNFEAAEVLLEHGANPNAVSETKDNPLHCAVASGNARLVGLLLDHGAKHDYMTDIGETLMDALPPREALRKAILEELAKRNIGIEG